MENETMNMPLYLTERTDGTVWIHAASGIIIAQCQIEEPFSPIQKANAEFIVRACNAYDDLLAACEQEKQVFIAGYGNTAWIANCADMEAAIRKAKGE